MNDFTIVTGISKNYLEKAKLTIPTWRFKNQFKDKKLVIFYSELEERQLKFFKTLFNDVELIKWDMEEYDSTRELMLSAFLLGVDHIKSSHYVKLDCDVFFTDDQDIFKEEHFEHDVFSISWGYTKPGEWLRYLDEWATSNNIEGVNMFKDVVFDKLVHPHKRFTSNICLHKTQHVKNIIKKCPKRLPIPSHDTFLWYMTERSPNAVWKAEKLFKLGASTKSNIKSIKKELDKFNVVDIPSRERSVKRYNYGYEENLFNKVQLEITVLCNLSCPNCDRSCGKQQAPSQKHMELIQIQRFVKKSLKLGWKWKRLDVIGGEPTLHPQLLEIFEELKKYKDKNPSCMVRITTNGKGQKVKDVIKTIPKWVKIKNTDKENNHISEDGGFTAFHDAPIDHGIENTPVCDIPWRCGLGMTPDGFYPCGAGGGIDRVFNLGIGIKTLDKLNTENLIEQSKDLCKLCGHCPTKNKHNTNVQETSETWKKAFEKYNE
jgi:hypothetical protein